MCVRIATSNVENLFARYRFRANFDPVGVDGFSINNLAFDLHDAEARRITGKMLREVDADVLCLQEVESLEVLDRFNSKHLGAMKYRHRLLIDSHDPRHIDVGVLSRYPIGNIRTHRDERNQANTAFLFSRDCLEATVTFENAEVVLLVNHFKSMMGGRDETRPRRQEQVDAAAKILDDRFGPSDYAEYFMVCGDFNDYDDGHSALGALSGHPKLENVVERLPVDDRWTHFWAGGNEYRQLDYLMLSPSLQTAVAGLPTIERRGMPYRAELYPGARFDDIGWDHPKASDHCPLAVDLDI